MSAGVVTGLTAKTVLDAHVTNQQHHTEAAKLRATSDTLHSDETNDQLAATAADYATHWANLGLMTNLTRPELVSITRALYEQFVIERTTIRADVVATGQYNPATHWLHNGDDAEADA